ncbi:UDP-xylose and UDP-N-acetylglucosamine transporter [Gorgonomyces haynaldii]|nr:UDP-xylose and UDP-N-acetylglucosamine transporter [Gorgonomyces haynaldii]
MDLVLGLFLIFFGCCSNVYTLELLVKNEPGSGHLVTFAQFLMVSIEGLRHHLGYNGFQHKIPLHNWFGIVVLFVITSVLNNYALGLNIAMPFHIIFRSGSLVMSMVIGFLFFKQRFSLRKIASVLIVTVGIILSSLQKHDMHYTEGVFVLVVALVLSCFLGQFQQKVYQKYGSHWREGLFYTHAMALPFFYFLKSDLQRQWTQYSQSQPIAVFGYQIPIMYVYLLLNAFTQYVCISGVQKLASVSTSVTLNLVLTLRKFVSLLLSVYLFQNPFSATNWTGAVLVLIGTLLYSDLFGKHR